MTWRPVLVGVDGSPEGLESAMVGWRIAEAAGARLIPVHGAKGHSRLPSHLPDDADATTIARGLVDAARADLTDGLRDRLPASAVAQLEVEEGHPVQVLQQAARRHDAELLILGGKHHAAPVRWFGGSTVHNAVRTIDVPILVVTGRPERFDRILAAIDLSDATGTTLEAARRVAQIFAGTVMPIHVVEPLPTIPDGAVDLDEDTHLRLAEAGVQDAVRDAGVEEPTVVCHGSPARAIADATASRSANLVVVGTHGKGWVDRVLLGSTTERLLNRLPTSVLVVPTTRRHGDSQTKPDP
ncbi:MAG: universal stress protein [Gemmatimonadales bacterium]|jgi:nucleotide-binding universal stress UspA family protein